MTTNPTADTNNSAVKLFGIPGAESCAESCRDVWRWAAQTSQDTEHARVAGHLQNVAALAETAMQLANGVGEVAVAANIAAGFVDLPAPPDRMPHAWSVREFLRTPCALRSNWVLANLGEREWWQVFAPSARGPDDYNCAMLERVAAKARPAHGEEDAALRTLEANPRYVVPADIIAAYTALEGVAAWANCEDRRNDYRPGYAAHLIRIAVLAGEAMRAIRMLATDIRADAWFAPERCI